MVIYALFFPKLNFQKRKEATSSKPHSESQSQLTSHTINRFLLIYIFSRQQIIILCLELYYLRIHVDPLPFVVEDRPHMLYHHQISSFRFPFLLASVKFRLRSSKMLPFLSDLSLSLSLTQR